MQNPKYFGCLSFSHIKTEKNVEVSLGVFVQEDLVRTRVGHGRERLGTSVREEGTLFTGFKNVPCISENFQWNELNTTCAIYFQPK